MKYKTYNEWKLQRGERVDLAARMLLSDRLVRSGIYESIKKASGMLAHEMTKALVQHGVQKGHPEIFTERDPSLRASEITLEVEGINEGDALSYLFLAEEGWRAEYETRLSWENKPLLSYLTHCITRTGLFCAVNDWWQGRKEIKEQI